MSASSALASATEAQWPRSWLKTHLQSMASQASLSRCVSSTVPVLWCEPTSTGPIEWHCANLDCGGAAARHRKKSSTARRRVSTRLRTSPELHQEPGASSTLSGCPASGPPTRLPYSLSSALSSWR
eukprot:scaffold28364_cov129-Isochrysis_galbana.AAC.3